MASDNGPDHHDNDSMDSDRGALNLVSIMTIQSLILNFPEDIVYQCYGLIGTILTFVINLLGMFLPSCVYCIYVIVLDFYPSKKS